jgi:hypothetical protein
LRKGHQTEKYVTRAKQVGKALVDLVEQWKREVSIGQVVKLILPRLLFDSCTTARDFYQVTGSVWRCQIQQIALALSKIKKDAKMQVAGHLNGDDENGGRVFGWYSRSGGQAEILSAGKDARWASERFRLGQFLK